MFDNIDGKQARRTKNSSPLGSLFDHCCDSMTSFLITGGVASVMKCTHLYQYAMIWLMVAFPFYATIWEENITKFFYLPLINGVSEGTLITCTAFHYFGYYGVDYFDEMQPVFGVSVQMRDLFLLTFFMIGVGFMLIS